MTGKSVLSKKQGRRAGLRRDPIGNYYGNPNSYLRANMIVNDLSSLCVRGGHENEEELGCSSRNAFYGPALCQKMRKIMEQKGSERNEFFKRIHSLLSLPVG